MSDAPAIPAASGAAEPGEKVTFVSNAGTRYTVDRDVAELSGLAKSMLAEANKAGGDGEDSDSDSEDEDGGGGGGGAKAPEGIEVLASAADDATLQKAVQFMEHFKTHPVEPVEKPIPTNVFNDLYADEFYRSFVSVSTDALRQLIATAELLQIDPMLEVCVVKVATMIKDHTEEEVDDAFGIAGELSAEESAKVFAENPWLKELAEEQ